MTCEDFLGVIDDYVDGDLSGSRAAEARAHLAGCPACRREEEGVRHLVRSASTLPEEMPLARDLWDRIDARLEDRPGAAAAGGRLAPAAFRGGRQAMLAAAMVVILVGAAVAAAVFFRRPAVNGSDSSSIGSPAPAGGDAIAPATGADLPGTAPLDEAGRALLEAKQSLKEAFVAQSGSLSPGTVRAVEENIRIIEAAVDEIQAALDKDPGNPQLRRLLITARQREVAVLTKVTRTAAARQMRW
jgi:hypothetical protein